MRHPNARLVSFGGRTCHRCPCHSHLSGLDQRASPRPPVCCPGGGSGSARAWLVEHGHGSTCSASLACSLAVLRFSPGLWPIISEECTAPSDKLRSIRYSFFDEKKKKKKKKKKIKVKQQNNTKTKRTTNKKKKK
eukprot:NODE_22312_length_713_cov_3.158703.p1 GENE.NODE_22312_length_713_cov_3.158703~~NODE_22312_length_713_cov_3.158703.p1  ORF type:complete len:135 (+),score=14.84 NODE_22312_length_713_cov_3.158703:307-711(+)